MAQQVERRQEWHRIVGVERRSAPLHDLEGHALPDPTLLLDEDFRNESAGVISSQASSENTNGRDH